ncbi:sphingomyelin phosphodiesterase-like [Sitophilus oryzae]|uniref:Sphingomyelin phosphodiesterase n=1 Tax=Sitophilus oryzae TaxID=7048 RepID=A0A6J2X3I9_SITOR|nr:sphingomyelin phosphodiesterase-like [Sitophilus oryzae]
MTKYIFFTIFVTTFIVGTFCNNNEKQKYQDGLKEFQTSRIISPKYNETLHQLELWNSAGQLKGSLMCELCYVAANVIISEFRANWSIDVITLEAAGVCTLLGIETGVVCRGVIDRNIDIFEYIIKENPDLKAERACDIILQNDGCNKTTFEWTVAIPDGETVQRKAPSSPESSFNILHISDIHYDPLYTEGKNKNCDEPLCCQSDQEDGSKEEGTACGYWSEYEKADTSDALIDEAIRKAAETEYEYVYFTGDAISHRVWATSIEDNTKSMKSLFGKMKTAFPNIPIYPCLGNHEPSPLNEYAITNENETLNDNLSNQWLYRLITTEFSEWLTEEASSTIMLGGFYTVSPKDGFRIIVVNSNVAYTMNWWLIHNDTDPFGQLAWLAETLKAAEDAQEVVHILSHIPSGKSDLLKVWSREYRKIIERFSNTIAAQFNGHTHHDQFMVYYSSNNSSNVINLALNGASVMSDKSNPSFKILNIDNDNYDVLDTEEWTFNLTEANIKGNDTPNWYKLYSFREQYGVSSLSPEALTEFMPRLAANHSLLYDYHILRYRNSDIARISGCDDKCKLNYLCEVSVSDVGNNTACDVLTEIFNRN